MANCCNKPNINYWIFKGSTLFTEHLSALVSPSHYHQLESWQRHRLENSSVLFFPFVLSHRYDKVGHTMEGQSLTEMKGGGGGGNTNWKTLSDVKNEHLGHGEKVRTRTLGRFFSCFPCTLPHSLMQHSDTESLLFRGDSSEVLKDKLKGLPANRQRSRSDRGGAGCRSMGT